MSDQLDNIQKIVDELTYKVTLDELTYYASYGSKGEKTLWEHKFRLHVRPKPAWCPDRLWAKLLSLVLVQSYVGQRKED